MPRFGWFTLFVICLCQICPAAAAEKPAGIDALRAYEGNWDITIDRIDTAHSKAGHEKSSLHNDCWKSGSYFACNQYVNGESKVLLVFTFDEHANEFTSYQIPLGGGQSGSGKLTIDGNVWTFPWQSREGETVTYFRVVNVFTGSDKIEYRQEFSPDNTHWTVMARGSEVRTGTR
ncbi:MAG TPA: hypothetical protein VGG85_17320 [Terracidiphilus sp.]